jgi:P4 family phage/plasmid primase-like protien
MIEDCRDLIERQLRYSEDRSASEKELKDLWWNNYQTLKSQSSQAAKRLMTVLDEFSSNQVADRLLELVDRVAAVGYRQPDDYFQKIEHPKSGMPDEFRFLPNELAKDLLENEHFITVGNEGERATLWYAEDGYYHEKGEVHIRMKIEEVLGPLARNLTRNQRIEVIENVRNATFRWLKDIKDDTDLIPLKNGVFNWKTREFRRYDLSKDIFFLQVPVDYDLNAKCPAIDKFLLEIVPEDAAHALIDFIAECLVRENIKDALGAIGETDSAKTAFGNLAIKILGDENVCAIPIQAILYDRFAKSRLRNKLLNLYDDLPEKHLSNLGEFNAVTGGGKVSHEKKHMDGYDFRPYAKHAYFSNKMPKLDVDSTGADVKAFFRRLHTVKFPYVFNENPAPNSNEKLKIEPKTLEMKLYPPTELSGLLNLCLQAIPHVMAHGPRWPASSTENVLQYFQNADPAYAFYMEFCKSNRRKGVVKEVYREVCLRYTDEYDLTSPTVKDIKKVMDNKGIGFYQDPMGVKPRNRYWKGIEIDVEKMATAGWGDLVPKVNAGTKEFKEPEITGAGDGITGSSKGNQNQSQESQGFQSKLGAIGGVGPQIEYAVKENAVIGCDSRDSQPKRTKNDVDRDRAELRRLIIEGGGE